MKILVISQNFPCKRHQTSGIFLANLMKNLATKVDKLIVITPRVYIPRFLTIFKKSWTNWRIDPMISIEHNIEIMRPFVISVPGLSMIGFNGVLMYYSLKRTIIKYIKNNKIDLIVGHNILPEAIAATRLAKRFRLPVVSWAIGSDIHDFARLNRLNFYLTKKCLINSNLVLAASEELKNCATSISDNISSVVKTFYRGIDLDTFSNQPKKLLPKRKLNLEDKKKYILYVGRIIRNKGIYELANSFIDISRKYDDYNLILIGEEIEKEAIINIFKNEGILNRVIFKGIIAHQEVANYMRVSDFLVFPSWAEGLPNVVIESMAIGLPVIASDVGGIPEIIKDEITGLLVPAQNVEQLTLAIVRMIEDKNLQKKCSNNAQKLVIENFDVQQNANKLLSFFRELKFCD